MPLTLNGEDGITYANLNSQVTTLLQPKNWIINGQFEIWQRGTSQTTGGYGSDDRWANEHSGSTKAQSQQVFTIGQTIVPNNPKYFSRTVVTSVAGISNFVCKIQKIEDVTKLAGKTVTVSFWAKADASKNLSIEFIQDFGTGGSTRVEAIGVQKFALTTSWQRFTKTFTFPTITGKTIGVDNNIRLTMWFDAGANFDARTNSLGQQSGTFDIANVSLVEGSVAVECQNQPYADVLRDCLRYHFRTFGNTNYSFHAFGLAVSATQTRFILIPTVPMRTAPTTISYSNLAATDGQSALPVVGIAIDQSSTSRVSVICSVSGATQYRPYELTNNNNVNGYIALDAEL